MHGESRSMIDYKFIIRKQLHMDIPQPQEPEVEKVISNIAGGYFVDVGANAGMYSIRYRRNFRGVYAVEPNPEMIHRLKVRTFMNIAWNVDILPFAASDKNGEVDMFLDGTMGRSAGSADTIEPNFVHRPASHPEVEVHYSSQNSGKKIRVKTKRLDDYPFMHPNEISLIKIDVEGAEFRVVTGAEVRIKCAGCTIVEVHDKERKNEMEKLLDRYGLTTRWLDADHILGR